MDYPSDIRSRSIFGFWWKVPSRTFPVTFAFSLVILSLAPLRAAPDDPEATAKVIKPEPLHTVARTYNGQQPPPEIKGQIDAFFSSLMKDEISKALEDYLKGTRLASREDSIRSLVENTQHAFVLYGKMTAFESIDSYPVGSRLLITTYLTVLPVSPLRWRFIYYKPDSTWQLLDLRVDDQLTDIVEQ